MLVKLRFLFLLAIISTTISAQQYWGFDYDLFTRNNFTPVETSLGGMTSFSSPSAFSHTLNPALLSLSESNGVDFSFRESKMSSNSYARLRSASINSKIGKIGTLGFTFIRNESSSSGNAISLYPQRDVYTFSLGRQFGDNLFLGLSYNYFNNDMLGKSNLDYSSVDLGAIYAIPYKLSNNYETKLSVGTSFSNLLKFGDHEVTSEYYSPFEALPGMFSLTLANEIGSKAKMFGKQLLNVNLQVQYSDEINTSAFDLWTAGSEITFLELLTLRYAYSEGSRPGTDIYSEYYSPKNTVGFGIKVPIGEMYKLNIPLNLRFDYGHSFMNVLDGFSGQRAKHFYNSFSFGVSLN